MTREEFEAEFNSRTVAYHPDYVGDDRPVVVRFPASADTEAGHALFVCLVNQLARAHRRIVLVGDLDRPLQCSDVFALGGLRESTEGLAKAINPFIDIDVAPRPPAGEALITLGIGPAGCELDLGADGWIALMGGAAALDRQRKSVFGGCLAASLGASAAFHRVLGDRDVPVGAYSLWDYAEANGSQGPDFEGPVDVGTVLQVGAGAVGAGLNYFMTFFGFVGRWIICDGDVVDVSNLNRQLLFLAADAGFPRGSARNKAAVVAGRLDSSAEASPRWWGEDDAVVSETFDLVLPLANEYAARPALQQRPQTVLLHGTTSANWEAQAHRHVAGRDGCISCRLPERPGAQFGCSEVAVGRTKRQDASLPFLSATASLLLLTQIVRLQLGALIDTPRNYHAVQMRSPRPTTQGLHYPCADGCRSWMPAERRLRRTAGTRFAHLDGDAAPVESLVRNRVGR